MVVEVGELHDPCQVACGPGRIRDPSHVDLVRLGRSVSEELQSAQFDVGEASPPELPSLDGTQLEQVMEPCRGPRARGDRGRDPLDVLYDWVPKAVALPDVTAAS
jgi:hypothetical protein